MYGPDVARRVTRGGAARIAGYAAGMLFTAVGSIFLLRHLGVEDFGRYGTVMALLTIVSGVTDAGLTITASRDMALLETPAQRRALMAQVIGARVALAVVGVAFCVAFAVAVGYGRTLVVGTAVAGAGVVLMTYQAALLVPLTVELANTRIALSETVRQGVLVAGIVALAIAGAGLPAFFLLQIAVGAAIIVLSPLVLGRGRLVVPGVDVRRWVGLLRRALPIAVASVLGVIYLRVLVILTSVLTGAHETGLYVTVQRIFELLAGLPLLLVGIVLPVLTVAAREDPGRLRYVSQRLTEVAAVSGTLIALVLLVAAEPILVALGGEQYRDAASVLRLQSSAVITLFLVAAWTPGLIALGRQRQLAIASACGLAAAVTFGAVLIPLYEAHGAAVAAALAELVNAGAVLVALRSAGLGRELQFGFALRLALVTAIALGVAFAVPAPAAVQGVIGAALFAVGAFAARLVPEEAAHLVGSPTARA